MKMKKRSTVSETHLETSALDMSAELKINGNDNLNNQDIQYVVFSMIVMLTWIAYHAISVKNEMEK